MIFVPVIEAYDTSVKLDLDAGACKIWIEDSTERNYVHQANASILITRERNDARIQSTDALAQYDLVFGQLGQANAQLAHVNAQLVKLAIFAIPVFHIYHFINERLKKRSHSHSQRTLDKLVNELTKLAGFNDELIFDFALDNKVNKDNKGKYFRLYKTIINAK
ncbi:hypothetical protein RhiirB3_429659 [Rhizophagus irregularis]|nr:hypothetical protein RhiirB3_429659 [Rhizophagus irregularis]